MLELGGFIANLAAMDFASIAAQRHGWPASGLQAQLVKKRPLDALHLADRCESPRLGALAWQSARIRRHIFVVDSFAYFMKAMMTIAGPALDYSTRMRQAALQVAVTLMVLAWVPGAVIKALVLLGLWALLFLPLRAAEVWMVAGVCLFFTGMNASALKQGIFQFRESDVLGMPVWELFMWGFYLLHVYRFWGDAAHSAKRQTIVAWGLGLAFATAFAVIADQTLLLGVTAGLLLIALVCFHDRLDLAYAGHMVLLGALVEYVGVHAGQWFYPVDIPGGVPPWFVTMWGGIGLFFRRLVLPWLSPASRAPDELPAR